MWLFIFLIMVTIIVFFMKNSSDPVPDMNNEDVRIAVEDCVNVASNLIDLATDKLFCGECLSLQIIPKDRDGRLYSTNSDLFELRLMISSFSGYLFERMLKTQYINNILNYYCEEMTVVATTNYWYKSKHYVLIPIIFDALKSKYGDLCEYECEKQRIIIKKFKEANSVLKVNANLDEVNPFKSPIKALSDNNEETIYKVKVNGATNSKDKMIVDKLKLLEDEMEIDQKNFIENTMNFIKKNEPESMKNQISDSTYFEVAVFYEDLITKNDLYELSEIKFLLSEIDEYFKNNQSNNLQWLASVLKRQIIALGNIN